MAKKGICLACGKEFEADVRLCPRDRIPLTLTYKTDNLVGQLLDNRYNILELISESRTGMVYKAQQTTVERFVAVKILHANQVNSAEAVERFRREAQATSALKHSNLLAVFDFGMAGPQPYMVTEYFEGVALNTLIEREGALPPRRVLAIFIQLCLGLSAAHQINILHRDLKPSNVLLGLGKDGREIAKIIDFGFVKFLNDSNQQQLTKMGQLYGSPAFMSPEQLSGQVLDPRSDVYSLACVLYNALAGKPAIADDDLSVCMLKQLNDAPPPFSRSAPQLRVPQALEEVVFKALSKKPQARHQSMLELRADLERILKTLPPEPVSGALPLTRPNTVPQPYRVTATQKPVSEKAPAEIETPEVHPMRRSQAMPHSDKGSNRLLAKDQYHDMSPQKKRNELEARAKQDNAEVITCAFISIVEALDEEINSLRQSGMEALRKGGMQAVTPIMEKTKQFEQLRQNASGLAQEWARLLQD